MRWLLVYGTLRLGGIETLIVRLANFLASEGHEVGVVTDGGALVPLLSQAVDKILFSERADAVKSAERWLASAPIQTTIVSFDPISAALGLAIECRASAAVNHISGVFHPRAYFMDGERSDRVLLNKLIAKAIGLERIFFMNQECRSEMERRWKIPLGKAQIIPLPVSDKDRQWRQDTQQVSPRIVSVGRLTDFKQYNLGAPHILDEVLKNSPDASWDIYGSGDLAGDVSRAISDKGLGHKIRLCGDLPYDQFDERVIDYDVFVGMGASAAEAAMLGVPTIVAIDSSRLETYGWFSNLPFGNVGERQEGRQASKISAIIEDFSQYSPERKSELSQAEHEAAKRYSLPEIAAILIDFATSTRKAPSRLVKWRAARLYSLLTDSLPIKVARRLRSGLN